MQALDCVHGTWGHKHFQPITINVIIWNIAMDTNNYGHLETSNPVASGGGFKPRCFMHSIAWIKLKAQKDK